MDTTHTAARLRYGSGRFDVIIAGAYVVCAVTGSHILLEDLKYWSVERQEAYVSPDVILRRYERRYDGMNWDYENKFGKTKR